MDQRVIYGLAGQLVLQGEIVVIAKDQYADAAEAGNNEPSLRSYARIRLPVQAILTAAAMASKILWKDPLPQRPEGCTCTLDRGAREKYDFAVAQRKELRRILRIKGSKYTVLQDRKVRNSVEHMDERLETYFAENRPPEPNSVEWLLAPRKFRDPKHHLGNVFADQFVILGEVVDFLTLADVVTEVAEKARAWINGLHLPEFAPVLI